MAIHNYSTALRSAQAQAIIDQLDAQSDPGTFKFYTTPLPATVGAAITTQTLLGTVTLAKPSGTVSNGVLTFSAMVDDTNAAATGSAAFVRAADGSGLFVADLKATLNGDGGPVTMASLQIYQGGTLHVTSATITIGNSTALS
jgi:hypothetical protein